MANLAAANCFTKDHLDEPRHWEMVTDAKFYYIAVSTEQRIPPPKMTLARTKRKVIQKTSCGTCGVALVVRITCIKS